MGGSAWRMLVEKLEETGMLYIKNLGWSDMDWIELAQLRDQWRALVNTVMNLRSS
jgi:hypothetical protein